MSSIYETITFFMLRIHFFNILSCLVPLVIADLESILFEKANLLFLIMLYLSFVSDWLGLCAFGGLA